jgi:hypothetical protein
MEALGVMTCATERMLAVAPPLLLGALFNHCSQKARRLALTAFHSFFD